MGEQEDGSSSAEISRRSMIKKLVAAGFAIPVISSFVLDGVAGASYNPGQGEGSLGNSNLGQSTGDLGESHSGGPFGHPFQPTHHHFFGNVI